jgi:hypothetical protein
LNGVDGWIWLAGSSATNQNGVYGELGVASGGFPGARDGVELFANTTAQNLYVFGGEGYDSAGGGYDNYLNDVWSYDLAGVDGWTWLAGSSERNQRGEYGEQGVISSSNHPGSRHGGTSFVDTTSQVAYIFGGYGYDSAGDDGYLGDLCEYSYCTHTVLTLYCTHTVLTLYSYQGRLT